MERDVARAVVPELLQKHQTGDRRAGDELAFVVRGELRRIARAQLGRGERPGEVRTAAPLNALYSRAVNESGIALEDHPAFLQLCARAMRGAVVEHMRNHREGPEADPRAGLVLEVDAALPSIESLNARLASVVECRYFAALTEEETAAALGAELPAIQRDWIRARAWLLKLLAAGPPPSGIGEAMAVVPNGAWTDAVFDDALGLVPEQRHTFLEHFSAAPAGLRADVEALLRLSVETLPGFEPGTLGPEFLWSILTGTDVAPPAPAEAAPRSGAWRIVRELRRGRVGPLYLAARGERGAEQMGALRYLKSAPVSDAFARRLRHEARSLASLKHAGIARLLDAGVTQDGRAFVVSEYIEGRPVHRHCDEELFTIDQRLSVFLRICTAVRYAHHKLIAHGAIKPSNIIVGADGSLKLVDLGLAVLLMRLGMEGEDAAVPAVWLPAPEYASPEQIRGEALSISSDVYQLGLLLYELVTGERGQIVTHTSTPALEQAIGAAAVVRPSERVKSAPEKNAAARRTSPRALARTLRGDLDAIVMHALRKDPERRYPSVSALRSDVQRFRERRPVWAQTDTADYRVRKFISRRRWVLGAGAALLAVGAAVLPAPFGQRVRAERETVRVVQAEQLLEDILSTPGAPIPPQPPDALHYVDATAALVRSELAELPHSQGRLLTMVGRSYAALGHYDRSIQSLEQALVLRRDASGGDSLEVAETLDALGRSQRLVGRYDEADTSLRTALAIRQVRVGAGHPDAIGVMIELGELMQARGQLAEAEEILRGTVTFLRPEAARAAADAPVNHLLPLALRALASVLRDRGVLGESAALYSEAIGMLRRRDPTLNAEAASAQIELSRLFVARADLDQADAILGQAVAVLKRVYDADHPVVALALRDMAYLKIEQGRLDEARDLLNEAQRIQEQRLGRIHALVPGTRGLQAELARRRGDLPAAAQLANEVLREFDRLGMSRHPWTVDVRATLGEALIGMQQFQEALPVLGRALSDAERMFVSHDPRIAHLQQAVARATRARDSR